MRYIAVQYPYQSRPTGHPRPRNHAWPHRCYAFGTGRAGESSIITADSRSEGANLPAGVEMVAWDAVFHLWRAHAGRDGRAPCRRSARLRAADLSVRRLRRRREASGLRQHAIAAGGGSHARRHRDPGAGGGVPGNNRMKAILGSWSGCAARRDGHTFPGLTRDLPNRGTGNGPGSRPGQVGAGQSASGLIPAVISAAASAGRR